MGVYRNPLGVFSYVRHDPFSVFFGVHHLITGGYVLAAIQASLTIAGIVLFGILYAYVSDYNRVCCYAHQSPSDAEYEIGGACNDPGSLMYTERDTSACFLLPLKGILIALFASLSIAASLGVYVSTYRAYNARIQGHIKYYIIRDTELENLHKEIQEDADDGGSETLYTMGFYVMFFPFVSVLLGLNEKALGNSFWYRMRIGALCITVASFLAMTTLLSLNKAWGCYPSFRYAPANRDVLDDGMCTDYTSDIFAATGGKFVEWTSTFVFTWMFVFSVLLWAGIYLVRCFGVKSRDNAVVFVWLAVSAIAVCVGLKSSDGASVFIWLSVSSVIVWAALYFMRHYGITGNDATPWIDTFQDAFIHGLQRYEAEME